MGEGKHTTESPHRDLLLRTYLLAIDPDLADLLRDIIEALPIECTIARATGQDTGGE